MKVIVFGNGQVGSAISAGLMICGHQVTTMTRPQLDLRDSSATEKFVKKQRADLIVNAAGISKGYLYNQNRQFTQFRENSLITNSVAFAAHECGIRLINILPSCIYPSENDFPSEPKDLFLGPMENSSMGYSTAKLSSAITSWAHNQEFGTQWVNIVLANVYGGMEADCNSHFIPLAISKIRDAKKAGLSEVYFGGSGTAIRDFLHVEDISRGAPYFVDEKLYNHVDGYAMVNVSGSGPVAISRVSQIIAQELEFDGLISFAITGSLGAKSKVLNGSKFLETGWSPKIDLESGIASILSFE